MCFLCRPEDSISHYEQQSKQRSRVATGEWEEGRRTARQSSVERELDALNSVDRVTRTEMVAGKSTPVSFNCCLDGGGLLRYGLVEQTPSRLDAA